MTRVSVVGVGQLGSRYLQGLSRVEIPLEIFAVEPDSAAVETAKNRWNDCGEEKGIHSLTFLSRLEFLPSSAEIAIIACSARERPEVVRQLASQQEVKFWLLEKYLAQHKRGLEDIAESVSRSIGCWVNLPYRTMRLFSRVRDVLGGVGPLEVEVFGVDYGVMTNCVHFVDLVAWLTSSTVTSVSFFPAASGLGPSKRPTFVDANGSVECSFRDGSTLKVVSADVPPSGRPGAGIEMTFKGRCVEVHFSDLDGLCICSNGVSFEGRVELQSELTAGVVEQITHMGSCGLPDLRQVIAIHQMLLNEFQEKWNAQVGHDQDTVQVT